MFREVEAKKSLGVGLDTEKFIGYDVLGKKGKTLEEIKEEKAIAKLVADLAKLEGKKPGEIEFHKKDFRVGGLPPPSRDGVKFRNGQRVSAVEDAEFLKKGIRRHTNRKTVAVVDDDAAVGKAAAGKEDKRGVVSKFFSFKHGWAKLAPGEEVEPPKERKEEEVEDGAVDDEEEERRRRKRKEKKKKKKKKRKEEEKKKKEEEEDSDSWSD